MARSKGNPKFVAAGSNSTKTSTNGGAANDFAERRKRRLRPGTAALREIRKFQKGTDLIMKRIPFQRVVREITEKYTESLPANSELKCGVRFQSSAMKALQEAAESFLIDVLEHGNETAIHAKRVTLMSKDIRHTLKLRFEDMHTAVMNAKTAASSDPRRILQQVIEANNARVANDNDTDVDDDEEDDGDDE